jgi:tetratricopeptide (TPR) repeat protein
MTRQTPRALLEDALAVQQETVALFPDDVVSRNGLAQTLGDLGRLEEAVNVYHETIARFPADVVARHGLAATLKGLGRLDEALRIYSETIRIFPDNVVARTGLAETLRTSGHVQEALELLEAIVTTHPQHLVARAMLADTLLRMGHAEQAVATYQSLVEEFPSNPVVRNGLAESLRRAAASNRETLGTESPQYRYQIALSFAGEDRSTAADIAEKLTQRGVSVFYDEYEKADLWGKDLYQHLASVYSEQAQFCIVLLSQAYASKLWTRHELKQAQARAFRESREYLLPVRLDDTAVPGISDTVGYIDLRNETTDTLIQLVLKKLAGEGTPAHTAI